MPRGCSGEAKAVAERLAWGLIRKRFSRTNNETGQAYPSFRVPRATALSTAMRLAGLTEASSEFIRSLNCWNGASIVSDIGAPLGIRIDAGLSGLSLILIS